MSMRKLFYFITALLCFFQSNAQEFSWGKRFGGEGEDVIRSLAVDAQGNSYATGYFTDFSIFGEGLQQTEIASKGMFDIFISKTSPNGELLWVKAIGGTSDDYATAITVDSNGNVYITGIFHETVNFNHWWNCSKFNIKRGTGHFCFETKFDWKFSLGKRNRG